MREKICKLFAVFCLMFVMTGCVKFNASMDIKKDKSMDFNIIYAFDTSLFGDQELLSDSDKLELQEKGFTVSDYVDGTMKGFTISRNIKNIDTVSATGDAEYSLSGILDDTDSNDMMFRVKKGFLKNTYTATLDFDASDSSLNDSVSDDFESDYEEDNMFEDEFELDTDDSLDEDFDFSGMASAMDLSFTVKVPYSAISNNATTVSDNGKTLIWNLTSGDTSSIEFEFELYNMNVIYIGGAIAFVIIIIIILMILNKKKNGGGKVEQVTPIQPVNSAPMVNPTEVKPEDTVSMSQQMNPQSIGNPSVLSNASVGVVTDSGVVPQPTDLSNLENSTLSSGTTFYHSNQQDSSQENVSEGEKLN